ncbi:hypothetical protein [Thalassoroseus pseudoceratinae]|uniref:hypothetical protein n=1 Tax=Thalassoroseus pseudoceratinae TaxID=2713176 RepID=UPI0014217408|nr:hypothetical protein [Thalassoroseus pseudoceratinae]
MNRLETAERRYRTLVSNELLCKSRVDRYRELPVTELEAWMEQYVVPGVEELWERPSFQELAAWPQHNLVVNTGTPERLAIEAVDNALVTAARALETLSRPKRIAAKLVEQNPPRELVASGTCVIGDNSEVSRDGSDTFDELAMVRQQVINIREKSWTDLVCPLDYFTPTGDRMFQDVLFTPTGRRLQAAEFVTSLNPRLLPVGDFITRCLMTRIDGHVTVLERFRRMLYTALRASGGSYRKQQSAEQAAWNELQSNVNQTRETCMMGPDFHRRDAAIVLAQVFVSYVPSADAAWLDLPEEIIDAHRGTLRYEVFSRRNLEVVERVANALNEIHRLLQELPEGLSAFEEAVASGGLVLRRQPRVAYWKTEKISADWEKLKKPWEMLWQLASKARSGSEVDAHDLYDQIPADSTMYNRWRRLEELLPTPLAKHVAPGNSRATYRLRLSRDEVQLFTGRLQERSDSNAALGRNSSRVHHQAPRR